MDGELSRATLLARGAATVVAASAFGGLASRASAAVPDGDLAYARLLVALELLSLDFYTRAIGAGGGSQLELRRARAAERRCYDAVAAVLTVRLESLSLGAYLGAVGSLQTPRYRDHAARAAASEAQHLSVLAGEVGGRRVGPPLPAALPLARVSDALDAFTS